MKPEDDVFRQHFDLQFEAAHQENVPKQPAHCLENPSLLIMQMEVQSALPQHCVAQLINAFFTSIFLVVQMFLSFVLQASPKQM